MENYIIWAVLFTFNDVSLKVKYYIILYGSIIWPFLNSYYIIVNTMAILYIIRI